MVAWLKSLDELLRGHRTSPAALLQGEVNLSLRVFLPLAVLLGAAYGFFMGWFSVLSREAPEYRQVLACMIKVPALFLLTLLVTFPSLYVFNALVGSRLDFKGTLRLLVGAIAVNLVVAASLGPILAFFTVSTTSYPFMVILNVFLLTIGGAGGLGFLLTTLRRLAVLSLSTAPPTMPPHEAGPESAETTGENGGSTPGMLDDTYAGYPPESIGKANSIFRVWLVIYALVGAQMGWILRPFIGNPALEFTWFRAREGNFFLAMLHQVRALFEPGG